MTSRAQTGSSWLILPFFRADTLSNIFIINFFNNFLLRTGTGWLKARICLAQEHCVCVELPGLRVRRVKGWVQVLLVSAQSPGSEQCYNNKKHKILLTLNLTLLVIF